MEQPETTEDSLAEILEDETEVVRSVLGREVISTWLTTGNIQQTALVLTDKRLYQIGTFFVRNNEGGYGKRQGKNVVNIEDLDGFGYTEKKVSKKIGVIGWTVLILGLIILLAGMIDGSVMGLVMGLFIGAVWMAVPGALMVFHYKTGDQKFLDVTHAGGAFAVSCRWFTDDDLAALEKDCTAAA